MNCRHSYPNKYLITTQWLTKKPYYNIYKSEDEGTDFVTIV